MRVITDINIPGIFCIPRSVQYPLSLLSNSVFCMRVSGTINFDVSAAIKPPGFNSSPADEESSHWAEREDTNIASKEFAGSLEQGLRVDAAPNIGNIYSNIQK